MDFSDALKAMKAGRAVTRRAWPKGGFVAPMDGLDLDPFNAQDSTRRVNDRTAKWIGEEAPLRSLPYLALGTVDGYWQPGWTPQQMDLFATDWEEFAR